ncbi:MAG: alpha/beta hydrolase [Lachnospiraceae bacterium]|nr:alpha/beta hydrolase [Lachnospiraceae bacterium]
MKINVQMTMEEILCLPQITAFGELIFDQTDKEGHYMTLKELQKRNDGFEAESVAYGLQRVIDLVEAGISVEHSFWNHEEIEITPDKKKTRLFFMPGKAGMPFVLICPGGAYQCVCTLKEGFPTGARLNELGYNAFILHYRVKEIGLMPHPLEDVAAALKYIFAKADEFQINSGKYAVAGFSSGGHLAAEWGTDNCGALNYGISKPEIVILGYPASDLTVFGTHEKMMLTTMLGKKYEKADIKKYNVNENISTDYPATYIFHCQDDPVIPVITSYRMKEKMENFNCPCVFREVPGGGHGFGLGEHTDAKGWPEEAIAFWETL